MFKGCILLHIYRLYFASCLETVFFFMYTDCILFHVKRLYFAIQQHFLLYSCIWWFKNNY